MILNIEEKGRVDKNAMIRLIAVLIFVILFLICSIPIWGVEWLIAKKYPHTADLSQLRIVQWAFKVVLFLSGTKVIVNGEENVPKDEAVLYIGNHRGFFDTVTTYARCPEVTGYVAKDSIEHVPLLSTWMKRLHCQFLNREDKKEGLKMILECIDLVKKGTSICIFPEGTRCESPDDTEMLPFKEGSFKIAEKTGCAVVPMAITGSADVFEKHYPWIKAATVTIAYGRPIYPKELPKDQQKHLGSYTQEIIRKMLKEQANAKNS